MLAFGFSLHIHFTSIFYPIIFLLSLPSLPRNKEVLRYLFLSMVILIPFILPIFLIFVNNIHTFGTASSYGNNYFHGLHLRRVIQLLPDSIIQFNTYFMLGMLQFLWIPTFVFAYLYKKISRNRVILCYLMVLFYLVPLLVMSTYSGEISDYYFMINRFLSLIIISYFIYKIFVFRNILVLKVVVVLFLTVYSIYNINLFLQYKERNFIGMHRDNILREIKRGEYIEFREGVPESYLFFYYTEHKSK